MPRASKAQVETTTPQLSHLESLPAELLIPILEEVSLCLEESYHNWIKKITGDTSSPIPFLASGL